MQDRRNGARWRGGQRAFRSRHGHRRQGPAQDGRFHRLHARRGGGGGRGCRVDAGGRGRPGTDRRPDRIRYRRPQDHLRRLDHDERARPPSRDAVLHPGHADQPGFGAGLDPLRLQGAQPFGGDGLRDRRACDRRRGADDHARRCRRDGRRRRGGGGLQDRHRGVRVGEGAFHRLQRNARARLAALGPGPRRVRDGRGRRHRRARGDGAREEARRQDIRRGDRLRDVRRRAPHHVAAGRRQWRLPVDAGGAQAGEAEHRRDRLYQRARDVDPARRRDRTRGRQAGLRRGRVQFVHVVHQVRHRAPPRGRRQRRGDLFDHGDERGRRTAHAEPRKPF